MMKKTSVLTVITSIICIYAAANAEKGRPVVMLTGFWNPTGLMIAQFCTDASLNPGGWQGGNWENYGFDVYSFFPEPGTYTGLFEVDYQDTWEDFWKITDSLHPAAIISFGAARPASWEIENNARNLKTWQNDYEIPRQPTPAPPDSTVAINYARHSTLPVQKIADAVNSQTTVKAVIDWNGNPQSFLCEYMAYLGMWYKAKHDSANDPFRCQAAGFIHVGDSLITLTQAKQAALVSIREVLKTLTVSDAPVSDVKNRDKISLVNYPNPSGSAMIIAFSLPAAQHITLTLYDIQGRKTGVILNGRLNSGKQHIEWKTGSAVSGVYLCRLETQKNGIICSKVTIVE